jgi:RNA 2',3'-cyclic 3'-phosphodiesterase
VAPERLKRPRVRLFVALDLPDAVREPLARWTRSAFEHPDLRPVRPESLHVTLVFLGYQYERDVARIAQAAFAAPAPAFALTARDVTGVPRSRPRLFALDLEDTTGSLAGWQAGLSERLHAAGVYEPEKRPFWPHVTLARAKRGKVPRGIEVPALPAGLRAPFEATRLTLYRSTLKPQGSVYEPLAEGKKTLVQ